MLSHEERSALHEIEARLRDESPELHDLLSAPDGLLFRPEVDADLTDADEPEPLHRPRRAGFRIAAAFVASAVLTTLVTLVAGPEVGAPVAVSSLCVAAMYGLTRLGGCPGAAGHLGFDEPEWRDGPGTSAGD